MYAAASCLQLKGGSQCDIQSSQAAHLAGHNGLDKEAKHCKHGQPARYQRQSVLTADAGNLLLSNTGYCIHKQRIMDALRLWLAHLSTMSAANALVV